MIEDRGNAVGPMRSILTIFIGALIATVVFLGIVYPYGWIKARRTKTEFDPPQIPFGVFLAPAAMVALLWGGPMISAYSTTMGL